MDTIPVQIALPAPLKEFVDLKAAAAGFGSPGDYIVSLVADAELRQAEEKLEAMLLEGIDGPGEVADDAWWAALRKEALVARNS